MSVTAIKIDPYLNIDAGTMAPTEHGKSTGKRKEEEKRRVFKIIILAPFFQMLIYFLLITGEVFVLDDGGEVDLDLGNYERYLNVTLGRDNNITTGKIYRDVIDREVSL